MECYTATHSEALKTVDAMPENDLQNEKIANFVISFSKSFSL